MSFDAFYSKFMQIPEYPLDIDEIDDGFENVPSPKLL
jgi:hypothetical protein